MLPHPDIPVPQLSRNHSEALAAVGVLHPQKILRQPLAEAAMNFPDRILRYCAPRHASRIDPFLNRDMRFGFELQVALARVVAVIVLQRPLDIDRVRVVTFDEIAVVAIHGAHEVGKRGPHALGQAASESCGSRGQFDG